MLALAKEASDFLVRLAFFAIAPFMLVFVAMLFPVTGAVVQIAAALVIFVAGEAIRRSALRWPMLRAVLAAQLEFDTYYRKHPPRRFAYYVFYPVLMPYWLLNPDARREFLLYKGYTLISFGLLLVSLLAQYARAFPPELSWRDFAPLAAGTFAVETAVVLMFLMPIVTSIVHFHQRRAPRRLGLLLLAALVSVGFATARLERRRDPMVSYATRIRVRLRSDANPVAARQAQTTALAAAWRALPAELDDVESDGRVEAQPLTAARETLATFYKLDEANAFDVWYSNQAAQRILVLYFQEHRGHAPIWLASDETGHMLSDENRLPKGAFRAMRRAAR